MPPTRKQTPAITTATTSLMVHPSSSSDAVEKEFPIYLHSRQSSTNPKTAGLSRLEFTQPTSSYNQCPYWLRSLAAAARMQPSTEEAMKLNNISVEYKSGSGNLRLRIAGKRGKEVVYQGRAHGLSAPMPAGMGCASSAPSTSSGSLTAATAGGRGGGKFTLAIGYFKSATKELHLFPIEHTFMMGRKTPAAKVGAVGEEEKGEDRSIGSGNKRRGSISSASPSRKLARTPANETRLFGIETSGSQRESRPYNGGGAPFPIYCMGMRGRRAAEEEKVEEWQRLELTTGGVGEILEAGSSSSS